MTYYESAEDITITRAEALHELKRHCVEEVEFDTFFTECGNAETYKAQSVLDWLGY